MTFLREGEIMNNCQKVAIDYSKTYQSLRDLRTHAKLTKQEFSLRLNIPIERIDAWEQEKELPDVIELCTLCNEFNTSPSKLIFTK